MKKIIPHFTATLASVVVTGATATFTNESVGFSTGVAFLSGMFLYSKVAAYMSGRLK